MSQVTNDPGEPPPGAFVIVSEDAPKIPMSKNAMKKAAKADTPVARLFYRGAK